MPPRYLLVVALLVLTASACSAGPAAPDGSAATAEPLAFDTGSGPGPTTTVEDESDTEPPPVEDLDPVIVEGLAQAVVADQSGQRRGIPITIDEARCLSARTVLAIGVDRLASLRLIDGGLDTAIAILSADERAVLVDATLECVPLGTLIGSAAGLNDQAIACLADELAATAILRDLALAQLSAGSETTGGLTREGRVELLDAIHTCVDLADLMFAGHEVSPESAGCVGDALRGDPVLDQAVQAVAVGEPLGPDVAAALKGIADRCLTPDELAALS